MRRGQIEEPEGEPSFWLCIEEESGNLPEEALHDAELRKGFVVEAGHEERRARMGLYRAPGEPKKVWSGHHAVVGRIQ